ncbi:hypothetical protein [uncultured Corynebacterium sp.]|uniref:hypothetical protein n=1 Tax=uncultured Corynebacterium sp. TaxID=159447 RepID=UPI0025F441D6|nr:hypothetical protein [uncultured Corynebacterium sp.]
MTRLQDYARQLASPMELLGEVSGACEAELRRLGLPRQEARSLLALADVYFGPTPFTRRQRSCRATKHCLATLKIIEKYVSRTKSKRDAWALRAELCATNQDVERLARTRLKELYPPRQPGMEYKITSQLLPPFGKVAHKITCTTRHDICFGAKNNSGHCVLPIIPVRILCAEFMVNMRHVK